MTLENNCCMEASSGNSNCSSAVPAHSRALAKYAIFTLTAHNSVSRTYAIVGTMAILMVYRIDNCLSSEKM